MESGTGLSWAIRPSLSLPQWPNNQIVTSQRLRRFIHEFDQQSQANLDFSQRRPNKRNLLRQAGIAGPDLLRQLRVFCRQRVQVSDQLSPYRLEPDVGRRSLSLLADRLREPPLAI